MFPEFVSNTTIVSSNKNVTSPSSAVAIGIMDIIIIPNKKTGNLVTIGDKIISNKNGINKSIINED